MNLALKKQISCIDKQLVWGQISNRLTSAGILILEIYILISLYLLYLVFYVFAVLWTVFTSYSWISCWNWFISKWEVGVIIIHYKLVLLIKLLFQTVCFHIGCVFKHCIADLPLDFFINVKLEFLIYFSLALISFWLVWIVELTLSFFVKGGLENASLNWKAHKCQLSRVMWLWVWRLLFTLFCQLQFLWGLREVQRCLISAAV